MQASPQGTLLESLTGFSGSNLPEDVSLFGADQQVEPPDTQIAVGFDYVVEMVDATVTARSRAGSILARADLNAFFKVPNGYSFSKPTIVFDASSRRWFAAGAAFDSNFDSQVYVAMSEAQDPTQRWTITPVAKNVSRIAFEQPRIGATSDKVVLNWTDFTCPTTSTCTFQHSQIAVLDKSDMVAMQGPRASFFLQPQPWVVPAQTLWGSGDALLAFYDRDSNAAIAGLMTFTGSPSQGGVGAYESDRVVTPRTEPPDAEQPSPGPRLSAGDSRLSSLVYRNGRLIGSQTISCKPAGDSTVRACAIVFELASDATVTDLFTVAATGAHVYYPAVMVDAPGNIYAVATESSTSSFASVVVSALPTGAVSPLTPQMLMQGTAQYNTTPCGGLNLWGEYSGAAADPIDDTDVWLAGEFAGGGPVQCPSGGWFTGIGRYTFAAPSITTASPTVGSTLGGASVVITGSDFVAGATSVKFGSVAGQSVQVLTPDSLTAVTAAQPAGQVLITVTTPEGATSGPAFTFLARWMRQPAPPS